MSDAGPVSRALGLIAEVEPREAKAVVISFVYFFFLMASYFILEHSFRFTDSTFQ